MDHLNLMPNHLDLRETTFTSLLLLGLDTESKESEYRIPFNRDMFATPNKKGMEVVLHFLFFKLDPDVAKETFRSCWFPHEKAQSQEFRKNSIEWLNRLKKEPDCNIPMASTSLLLSPTGEKFYQFLFYFSKYVLTKQLERLSKKQGFVPPKPLITTVTKSYTHQVVAGQSVSTINGLEKLLSFLEDTAAVKEQWRDAADEYSKEHKRLKKRKKECERLLDESLERSKLLFGKSSTTAKDALKRTQDMQKVTDIWNALVKFYESQKVLSKEIEQEIISNGDGCCLDGKTIDFKLPDILVRECERQMHLGNQYENIYQEGKIDLTSLLRMWNLCLHLVLESLKQYPLLDMTKDCEFLKVKAHEHQNLLSIAKSLGQSLSDEVNDTYSSIDSLRMTLAEMEAESDVDIFSPSTPFDILPSTPRFQLQECEESVDTESSQNMFTFQENLVATPEAVKMMMNKLENTVVKDPHTPISTFVRDLTQDGEKAAKNELKKDECSSKNGKKGKGMRKSAAQSKIPTLKPRNQKENIKPLTEDGAGAEQILINQITDFVVSSDTDAIDNPLSDLHAFQDPVEAFSSDVFLKQDKITRTPESRKALECSERSGMGNPSFISPLQIGSPLPLRTSNIASLGVAPKVDSPLLNDITPHRASINMDSPLLKDITPLKLNTNVQRTSRSCLMNSKIFSPLEDKTITPLRDSLLKGELTQEDCAGSGDGLDSVAMTPAMSKGKSDGSWWCNTPEFTGNGNLLTPSVSSDVEPCRDENTLEHIDSLKFFELFQGMSDGEL